jgi:hypothetical protein
MIRWRYIENISELPDLSKPVIAIRHTSNGPHSVLITITMLKNSPGYHYPKEPETRYALEIADFKSACRALTSYRNRSLREELARIG